MYRDCDIFSPYRGLSKWQTNLLHIQTVTLQILDASGEIPEKITKCLFTRSPNSVARGGLMNRDWERLASIGYKALAATIAEK